MTYTLRHYIEEREPAWKICEVCGGTGEPVTSYGKQTNQPCRTCHGEGGKFHEALIFDSYMNAEGKIFDNVPHLRTGVADLGIISIATKSSFLTRKHNVCQACGADDPEGKLAPNGAPIYYKCDHCHGTGCEPDTATPWEVE